MARLDELHQACEVPQPDLQKVERLMRACQVRSIPVGARCFERRLGLDGGVDVHELPRRVWRDPALSLRRRPIDGGLGS